VTRNVSGVQTNFGYGSLYEAFALRGFETNVTLRDGERPSGGIGRSAAVSAASSLPYRTFQYGELLDYKSA